MNSPLVSVTSDLANSNFSDAAPSFVTRMCASNSASLSQRVDSSNYPIEAKLCSLEYVD